MLYCPHCKQLWKESPYASIDRQETNATRCPSINCSPTELIPIDDNIAVTIAMLNKHGYTTRWSCSGHIQSAYSTGWTDTYIRFEPQIKIPRRIINKYKDVLRISHGVYEDQSYTVVKTFNDSVADISSFGTQIKSQLDIFRRCKIMLEFAIDLCGIKRRIHKGQIKHYQDP